MRIAEIAGVANDADAVARLKVVLVPLGREYRRVISITPSELDRSPSKDSLSQRLEWLDTQVLNPLMKLNAALHPDNRSMLSLWPQEVNPDLMPDLDEVARHLDHLQLLAQHVALMLVTYRRLDLPHGALIRHHIVAASVDALERALPDLKPRRGTYDRETKGFNGVYPDLIRAIYKEITGEDEQLDRLIKEQVDERRNPTPPDPQFSYSDMLRGLIGLPPEDDATD
ncbi:hypothetical protein GRI58_08605 [Porphyrobacter algicida]|uniref:Uncharacterized protein n=1 Tax=Qipengyuania algicida TaxID=1836209 RepID=A0A845AIZ0_9SPHN|nr:hypothetical protein [Qipengyuania algicida]MXP28881.1 hypothetical protein [Qipengyuania algicida]